MSDWTSGYSAAANIGYIFGYYNELNPLNAQLTFANAGLVAPSGGVGCELGFGQGMSVNIHAAASDMEWWGTDFTPSQAGFAQELAAATGANAKLSDEAFAEFCSRKDLPDFDFIGMHGIWSWISTENRAVLVDFFRRKLKVGGVLYISYNAMPGWSSFAPIRRLFTEHAEVMAAPGRGILSRVDAAIAFTEKLFETNPLFVRANPLAADRLKGIKEQNRHYLAHEYFNQFWEPMPFSDMAAALEPAKLDYACSAHSIDHVDTVNLTPEQRAFLSEVPDLMFRQTVRDFMVNQQFRRDYWVKGARRMTSLTHLETLRAQRIVLVSNRDEVPLKVNGALGEATMHESVYGPVLDVLADNNPKTIGEIEAAVASKNVAFAQVLEAVLVLAGARHIQVAQTEATAERARKKTDKMNAYLLNRARGTNDVESLASPVTGGGIHVPRLNQLFLLAKSKGAKTPAEWAAAAWKVLDEQGHRVLKGGKTLETGEDNLAELNVLANALADKRLPILKALGIA